VSPEPAVPEEPKVAVIRAKTVIQVEI